MNQEISFTWESPHRPELDLLREKYHLANVVAPAKGEFTQQLLLKDWVHHQLPHGHNPKKNYQSSLAILGDIPKGGQFYCSHYALVFIQTATALGWYSRKVSIDYDHKLGQEEMHHGITDIWSNRFNKWYVVDAMHNLHFEVNDTPLNALEIRQEFISNQARDLHGVVGNHEEKIPYSEATIGFDQPSNYFWFFILLINNFFADPQMHNSKALLWSDSFNQKKKWYMGGGSKGKSHLHPMYQNQFIKTNDANLCFPDMAKTNHSNST